MIFITKNNRRGVVELLILLPLFIGLSCLVGGIGYLLIQKTKLDKKAWVLQTQETFHQPLDDQHPYSLQNDRGIFQTAQDVELQYGALPYAFRGFLLLHPSKQQKLIFSQEFPNIFRFLYNADLSTDHNASEDFSKLQSIRLTSPLFSPGDAMADATLTKNGIWADEMREAGFNYMLLQILGYYELVSAGIPGGVLSDNVMGTILNNIPEMPKGNSL